MKNIFCFTIYIALCLFLPLLLAAQNGIPVPQANALRSGYPKTLQYSNMVYKDDIKTILFTVSDHNLVRDLSDPFIPLGGGLGLVLSFDEMGNEAQRYTYSFIHCTHDWQPSNLHPFDYIDGFVRNDITDYNYSFALTQQYVHYRLEIPNSNTRFTKSGNYLLVIYANDSPDDLVLSRRFVVYENEVGITVNLRPALSNRYFKSHQRLEFSITTAGLDLFNPIEQIYVNVLQNGRWDNAAMHLKPTFLKLDEMVYSPDMQTTFAAGNEFRFADLRNLNARGTNVAKIVQDKEAVHVFLQPDKAQHSETKRFHINNNDLNGKYFIGITSNKLFNRLDADYALTYFSLQIPRLAPNAKLYVFGMLSDWAVHRQFEMDFNEQTQAYEKAIWLKQGLYDYQYVIAHPDSITQTTTLDVSLTEGNYAATENVYYIFTYMRTNDLFNYDRVIGFKCLNSGLGTLFDVNFRCD